MKPPVPADKFSTAHLLHQIGVIAAPEANPNCKDLRGADEADRMREALVRPKRIAGRLGIPGLRV